MTKNEARDILERYQLWRRGEADIFPNTGLVGVAIDAAIIALGDAGKKEAEDLHLAWMDGYYCGARMKKSSIAQSIRDAAVNWPQYLSGVECQIIDAFQGVDGHWWQALLRSQNKDDRYHVLIFMLLVAEALE